jgi:hypothetical protein
MSGPRLELDALRETWRSAPAPDAGELSRLRREVAAQTRRLYLTVAAETTGALLGAAFFFYLAGSAHGAAAIAYGALGLATLVSQAWALRLRRDLWRARAATPKEYLRLQLRRSEARARIATASLFAGPLGVVIGFALQQLAPTATAVRLLERAGTIGIALVLAAFTALLLHGWRVRRRERVHRRSLERQLAELDG